MISSIEPGPRLTIHSPIGRTNQILASDRLVHGQWEVLTNLPVSSSLYSFLDRQAAGVAARFYRVLSVGDETNPAAPPGMALIEGGVFIMGDTLGDGEDNERPPHEVRVHAFFMDVWEVTKGFWDSVKSWGTTRGYVFDNPGQGKDLNHPVQTINWFDAVKWCNARSEREGLPPVYYTDDGLTEVYRAGQFVPRMDRTSPGYRLPTEAEWEKAARGGETGHRFPWSNTEQITHQLANYYSSTIYDYDTSASRGYHLTFATGGYPYTSPVGSFPPNAYGLYDLAGNVWEWCWDWHDAAWYASAAASAADPIGPATGTQRVLRGGSWSDLATGARCSYRYAFAPTLAFSFYGFRCVRSP